MTQFKSAQTIVLANQKGGCGKTTTAISISAGFALEGYSTCLVDLDSQCNVTTTFDLDLDRLRREGRYTILDAFLANKPGRDIEIPITGRLEDNLSIIPGHRALDQVHGKLEADLKSEIIHEDQSPFDEDDMRAGHRQKLKNSLASLRDHHDIIVIDTPPALGFLLTSALIAADWYLIPVFASGFDLDGLTRLTGTVKKVRERTNPALSILGVVHGNFDTRTALDRGVYEKLAQRFGDRMCETKIHQGVNHREATLYKTTIFEHAPSSQPARQYRELTKELLKRLHEHDAGAAKPPAQAPLAVEEVSRA